MIAPILLPAVLFLMILGESFLFFLVPLAMSLFLVFGLAKRLEMKDAITYSLVQYPFLVLVFILLYTFPPGLGFILTFPMTFIINMVIGYCYFRFTKNKRWFTKASVLLITLVITVVIYPTPTIAFPPSVEYGEFPFRIVYETNGETHEIEDTIVVRYGGIGSRGRIWSSSLESGKSGTRENSSRIDIFNDTDVPSAFTSGRMNEKIDIWISLGSPAYYMGDRKGYNVKSEIMYSETYKMSPTGTGTNTISRAITKNQLSEHFGIEIIIWSFSEPIKNTFR
jgi:hypothetical protein